uniref:Reverse transcriptase domain-containing protein n=1 Tax=Tanacetum cinerariifolium TaxID=118510 RepID=A0A6L2NWU8_TANCI|nr:reverse transcriptase domain-containing protein [Tanacetum cinerariifolium]
MTEKSQGHDGCDLGSDSSRGGEDNEQWWDTVHWREMILRPWSLCIDIINEILEEYFDALFDEGSKILHSIEGTILKEEIFSEFDKFILTTANEKYDFESDTEEPPFEKITINIDYKIKTSLEEPPTNLKLKPLLNNLEYVFLEEPSFLSVIISSKLSAQKMKTCICPKKHKEAFAWKTTDIPGICPSFIKDKKGIEIVAADHLSRIDNNESSDDSEVEDNFPRETLMEINTKNEPCTKAPLPTTPCDPALKPSCHIPLFPLDDTYLTRIMSNTLPSEFKPNSSGEKAQVFYLASPRGRNQREKLKWKAKIKTGRLF